MKPIWVTAKLDISESLRAKWFLVYTLVFGGIVALLFLFGVTESRVLGFFGLTRLLVTYIQMTMAILPVFVLISTVRSVAGDREAGVLEYLLSLPVSLKNWYYGKLLGRFIVMFFPVFFALLLALIWGLIKGIEIPWKILFYDTALIAVMVWCFLGMGMLISSLARSIDIAQGIAFIVWLSLLLFIDLILLGFLIQNQIPAEWAVAISLVNPLQVFRTSSLMLFDPQLILLGPSAYVIFDHFGQVGYLIYGIMYPFLLGILLSQIGYLTFRKGDLP